MTPEEFEPIYEKFLKHFKDLRTQGWQIRSVLYDEMTELDKLIDKLEKFKEKHP